MRILPRGNLVTPRGRGNTVPPLRVRLCYNKGMKDIIEQNISGLKCKENEEMKKHTTFKVGGPAQYFCEVNDKVQLHKVLAAAKKMKLPFFIFGGGSNILVSDKGIKGFVIKLGEGELEIKGNQIKIFSGNNLRNCFLFVKSSHALSFLIQ